MLNNIRKQREGFTIVEVLIVLAIAGLIILIVLIAIPALQRNSRNTRLRNDASKAASILQEVINNNNGQPVNGTPFTPPPVLSNENWSQASAINYWVGTTFQDLCTGGGCMTRDTLYIRNFSTCDINNQGAGGGTSRQHTISYLVEAPGTGQTDKAPANFKSQCILL